MTVGGSLRRVPFATRVGGHHVAVETGESGDEIPATALTAGAAVLGLLMALFGVYWDEA